MAAAEPDPPARLDELLKLVDSHYVPIPAEAAIEFSAGINEAGYLVTRSGDPGRLVSAVDVWNRRYGGQ